MPVTCPGVPRAEAVEKRIARAGPIPVELLRCKFVEGRAVDLKGNPGLTLPSNIGELGNDITELDLSDHNLRGPAFPDIPRAEAN